jgi:hypothetical protein
MLTIDGTDQAGCLSGDGTQAPWAIFDDQRQDWIKVFRFRWMAVLWLWLNKG